MKLTDALKGIQKVLETEGNLEAERVIITKDEFMIIKGNLAYTVDDYEKLIKDV
jgi:hypothetical protein